MKQVYALIFFFATACSVFAQQKRSFEIPRINRFDPSEAKSDFAPKFESLEAPTPGGDSYKSFLMRQKAKARQEFPADPARKRSATTGDASLNPVSIREFGMTRYVAQLDSSWSISGGTPLDNTMAISNDGLLLGSVNSFLWGYDTRNDEHLFQDSLGSSEIISFANFAGDSLIPNPGQTFPFDPKLLYDPVRDRFMFVFLDGRGSTDSQCIIGFSSSNDPRDPWNVYALPGNPRNNPEWTDYPAIAYNEEDLFLTVNLIEENVSWQEGFRGTIIWQMNLDDGYSGAATLRTEMWDDIRYNGRYIRNLNPVEGAEGPNGTHMYFLSNRNFDIQNDSIFMVEITDSQESGQAEINISVHILDEPYGVPPNGRQEDTPAGAEDSLGLQTNDARWLGAVELENRIHFVGNTRNFSTGLAALYHGVIEHVGTDSIRFSGHIIGSDSLDYGYPKIAFAGAAACEEWMLIGFDHTSPTVFAGVSAIFYNHETETYSEVIRLKEGEGYVRRLSGAYERWGDYFGIQPMYNEPGVLWTSGFYGMSSRSSSTWFNEIRISDSLCSSRCIDIALDTQQLGTPNLCEASLTARVSGLYPPFDLLWNNSDADTSTSVNICNGAYELRVIDDKNCEVTKKGVFTRPLLKTNVFPNPVQDRFTVTFSIDQAQEVEAYVISVAGQERVLLGTSMAQEGSNAFSFSTAPLAAGVYVFLLTSGDRTLVQENLVKLE